MFDELRIGQQLAYTLARNHFPGIRLLLTLGREVGSEANHVDLAMVPASRANERQPTMIDACPSLDASDAHRLKSWVEALLHRVERVCTCRKSHCGIHP